ncbi:unnamed protein product [Gordionus sp. m RMFG-2023]|uniref:polypeptide N-acetylgalactosaminyltransferase 13-like n=1 Tax=Gordionus sp. m RMFG-2023 TaxID=3053472 RepID=UPI0030DE27F7
MTFKMKYKYRFRTPLIIILTSLFWIFIDVFLITIFTDKAPYCINFKKELNYSKRFNPLFSVDVNPKIIPNLALSYSSSSSNAHKDATTTKNKSRSFKTIQVFNLDLASDRNKAMKVYGAGAFGFPVQVPENLKSQEKTKFSLNQFNLVASEMIPLNRTLKDYRIPGCATKQYPVADLPPTTVIIVFHNEAWTTLLRTIISVINRSPPHLLAGFVLVDDASDRDVIKRPLDDFLDTLRSKVDIKIERLQNRSGLIKARLIGADLAKGPVLTFLDAHCEVTIGWLEPLLYQIYLNKSTASMPIIDVISDDTFEYVAASDMTWGGFNWHLNFRWYNAPRRELDRRNGDRTIPLRSPTMAGGLFSIDKEYFNHIGRYDSGMEVWGGENLEMSFRIWMCGGTIELVTCSRVGHVFRKTSPYSFPGGVNMVINKNQRRTAEVWLDEWKSFFYKISPSTLTVDAGDLTERFQLRERLKCKSFKWYLENIYPEAQMPRQFISLGEIRQSSLNMCIDTMGRKLLENVGLFTCHDQGGNQVFMYSPEKLISNDDVCLQPDDNNKFLIMNSCDSTVKLQQWIYDKESKLLLNSGSGLCATIHVNSYDKIPMQQCDKKDDLQKWQFVNLSL